MEILGLGLEAVEFTRTGDFAIVFLIFRRISYFGKIVNLVIGSSDLLPDIKIMIDYPNKIILSFV